MSRVQLTNAKVGAGEYAVIVDGRLVGTVRRARTPVARNVSNMGGTTYWVGTLIDGTIVTASNTYRRIDAVDVLVDAAAHA
jgi:Cu/Ag efflux pump CusA